MKNMNVEMGDLRAFVAVADLGSFAAAARELYLSQPALSRRILKLENSLGVRLLNRTTRRIELSAPGRAFLGRARQVLNDFDESLLDVTDAVNRLTGEVTLACVPTVINHLPEVLKQYQRQYPGILVRVLDEGASDVLTRVTRGEADFGINYLGAQEGNLVFEPLHEDDFVLVCLKSHPLATRASVRWAELGSHDYIAVNKASGNRMLLDLALARIPDLPKPVLEARHVRTVIDLVAAGLGVATVPRLAIPASALDAYLVAVPLREPAITRSLGLITRHGQLLSPAAQRLCDLLRQRGLDTERLSAQ
ncbi:LysR family transcriptional regulator [Pseudomonas oryzihabitans]|uniref:LysR family transcriptional regulator n=1 Tax=Pseudomonas oryzihabitans TaxID=47885 RepID=UPI002893D90F|nr:LysR family transcriptional regulator [Pseudomonas oryzihabitans]MDT3718251.1 LysR family transcriptional regulator [Pseudomonas oryzihabitans]